MREGEGGRSGFSGLELVHQGIALLGRPPTRSRAKRHFHFLYNSPDVRTQKVYKRGV